MSPLSTLTTVLTIIAGLTINVHCDCRKTFIYHPIYNYGYDIYCTNTTSLELSTTMAAKPISLHIDNSNITFDHQTFKYLKKIRQLNITNAQIKFNNANSQTNTTNNSQKQNINVKTNTNILHSLTNLDTLIIQNSNITTNDLLNLQSLENLITLKLDNDTIETIPLDVFKHLTSLKILSLNHNRIKHIGNLSLCSLNNLRQLHLGNNLIIELINDDIKCLNQLEVLNLSGNSLTKLHGIASTSLNILSVASNQIDCIEKIDAPNLTILNASTNKLTNVTVNDFKSLNSLHRLDLSLNNLTSVVLNNKLLQYLDLSHNNLNSVPEFDLKSLRVLNLSFNQIKGIDKQNVGHLNSLETIEITNNNLSLIDQESFVQIVNLTVLNLSYNNLSNMSLFFVKNSTLQLFNLSHNNFHTMTNNWFVNTTKLKHLDVSYNKLKSLNDTTFKFLDNLETLNMSNNLLTQLDYKLLEPLENLIILDVDSNLIQEIDYGSIVSELPNLDAFKAKNNLLTCEFLTKMIHYFKDNDITFSLNEHLDFDKENVEGIYCKETRNKLLDMKKTEDMLVKNTKVLDALYEMYKQDNEGITVRGGGFNHSQSYSLSGGEIVACVFSLISLVVLITLAVQKSVLWYKRRHYLVDELELITNEPYKRLG